mgnify:FL=1
MARQKAISILQATNTKADLKEISGFVIDGIRKNTLASALKSQMYNGNPAAGSVEFRRFKNASSAAYGTARTAGKGTAITAPPTVVNLDKHKEIVEECAKFDLDTFGVGNIMARRADNHVDVMSAELDTAFFAEAKTGGTAYTNTESLTDVNKIIEDAVLGLESVKNDYVSGVPRYMVRVILCPEYYSAMRLYFDDKPRANVTTAEEEFDVYHGIKCYSSIYLPTGVKFVCMIDGAIAQPVVIYPYKDPEKIPLSNDVGISLFYDYGTKTLTPDLCFYYAPTTQTTPTNPSGDN